VKKCKLTHRAEWVAWMSCSQTADAWDGVTIISCHHTHHQFTKLLTTGIMERGQSKTNV